MCKMEEEGKLDELTHKDIGWGKRRARSHATLNYLSRDRVSQGIAILDLIGLE